MGRGLRLGAAGVPVHVVQRGNNRAACFAGHDDYRLYLRHLHDAADRFACALHAYVLMTNHVHLLLTPREPYGASRLMQHLGRRYVRTFNETHGRTGTLWEGRFRSSVIDGERYFLTCLRYIEHNPVRAGMVRDALDYPWSSYRHHSTGPKNSLITEHECFLRLGTTDAERRAAYLELCGTGLAGPEMETIRRCTNKGLPLGSEDFQAQMKDRTYGEARRARPRPVNREGSPLPRAPQARPSV